MSSWKIDQTELVSWLQGYDGPKFQAIVCDPPYALISIAKRFGKNSSAPAQEGADGRYSRLSSGFMNARWDSFESLDQYREWVGTWAKLLIEKALEPGAVCLFFGGTRTWHHLALGLEQGGFDVYDTIMWLHGQGFPKSHDVSKGLDKSAGAEREIIRTEDRRSDYDGSQRASRAINKNWRDAEGRDDYRDVATRKVTIAATPDAETWEGFGTALKPAWEPILLCRAPRDCHTFAQLATEHSSGALNIDGTRISGVTHGSGASMNNEIYGEFKDERKGIPNEINTSGRWPANLILSHHEDCIRIGDALVENPSGDVSGDEPSEVTKNVYGKSEGRKLFKSYRVKPRVINRWKEGMKPFGEGAGGEYETVKPTKARMPDGSANPEYQRPDEESPWKMPPGRRRPTKTKVKSGKGHTRGASTMIYGGGKGFTEATGEEVGYSDDEGYELVDRWACVPECPARQLDDSIREGLGRSSMGGGLHSGNAESMFIPDVAGFRSPQYYDVGGPSRFFYTSKADRGEKDLGLEDFYWKRVDTGFERIDKKAWQKLPKRERARGCIHPTVKPIAIIRYLATLIVPPKQEGIIRRMLIPFSGSGSEIIGAVQAGWDEVIGIEMEAKYNDMARARLRGAIGMF